MHLILLVSVLKVNFGILAVARNLTFLSDPEKIIIFVFIVYVFLITPVGWFGVSESRKHVQGNFQCTKL